MAGVKGITTDLVMVRTIMFDNRKLSNHYVARRLYLWRLDRYIVLCAVKMAMSIHGVTMMKDRLDFLTISLLYNINDDTCYGVLFFELIRR